MICPDCKLGIMTLNEHRDDPNLAEGEAGVIISKFWHCNFCAYVEYIE